MCKDEKTCKMKTKEYAISLKKIMAWILLKKKLLKIIIKISPSLSLKSLKKLKPKMLIRIFLVTLMKKMLLLKLGKMVHTLIVSKNIYKNQIDVYNSKSSK